MLKQKIFIKICWKIKIYMISVIIQKIILIMILEIKKVLVKYKDELNSKIITEFIELQSKMNSFEYIDNDIIVNKNIHKGIKR